ncbi:hypothetical protein MMC18_009510 [Xylographa bjoerkii]|nr:hypothetical protein [Xylographa bjoerkii]
MASTPPPPSLPSDLLAACTSNNLPLLTQTLSALPLASQISFIPPLALLAAEQGSAPILSHLLALHPPSAALLGEIRFPVVAHGSISLYRALLAGGDDIRAARAFEGDALTAAVAGSHAPLVAWLLTHGAPLNNTLWADRYPTLALGAHSASIATVEVLLDHGAVLKGSLALQLAAGAGRVEMMEFLVGRGADVNENVAREGVLEDLMERELGTALHFAAGRREAASVRWLLERGADVGVRDEMGRSVLERSRAGEGRVWVELEKMLGERRVGV